MNASLPQGLANSAGQATVPSDVPPDDVDQEPIVAALLSLRGGLRELERAAANTLDEIPEGQRASARNLIHYVALRSQDIRPLQELLVQQGLSSMGRCEAFVLANLETVLRQYLNGTPTAIPMLGASDIPCDFSKGRALLARNTRRVFRAQGTRPQIMVTMPTQAATDARLVHDLLAAGMTVMRINCAHDDPQSWLAMIRHLRQAEQALGQSCSVAMDLAGPKIRTGNVGSGPRVLSWNPKRDNFGRIHTPARIRFSPRREQECEADADVCLPVSDDWWEAVAEDDVLKFVDTAGRNRRMRVLETGPQGFTCHSKRSAYVDQDTVFHVLRTTPADGAKELVTTGKVGPLAPKSTGVRLAVGDLLRVVRPMESVAEMDLQAASSGAALLACTLPEVFRDTRVGHRILLDDGKISGQIIEASERELLVKITQAKEGGQWIREDKGINFPDSELNLPALTAKDLEDLEFVAAHADLVNYSFVRRSEDIRLLSEKLAELKRPDMGVIIKIENRQAIDNLPLLLLELMRTTSMAGVMIARGDLAVECGWERLVELQEEILWMCEAAHIPVVWATQVLDRLAKQGLPTRAEITDAGLSARAECVMLNKGPNIVHTVESLSDILRRMQQHQSKKRATFRRLKMTDTFYHRLGHHPLTPSSGAGT